MNHSSENIPWVEKYRPTNFKDIVLDEINKKFLLNIIESNHIPNLLLYGPPGTGKTTTIINLINKYYLNLNIKKKGLFIHLNASDDRGIDIIRNQINQFVNTKSLFINNIIKFVILDEVDYMTKNAQQALRYLIQQYSTNVRFCLICNYISRIDTSLQNEFIKLRFSQLPQEKIFIYLKNIIDKEAININNEQIKSIQIVFNSDIRSMINYLQSNHNNNGINLKIISNKNWDYLIQIIKKNPENGIKIFNNYSLEYSNNINKLILNLLDYILKNEKYMKNEMFILAKNVLHSNNSTYKNSLNYLIYSLHKLLNN
jgi:DNA polymerase III delta prime subunit